MKKKYSLFFIVTFLINIHVFSQEDTAIFIQNINILPTTSNLSVNNNTNSINITQVGINNNINTNIISENSNIKFHQNGYKNYSHSYFLSDKINAEITQIGISNYYSDFSINKNIPIKLELTQNGNNLNFDRFGVNDMTKYLKINMKGNNKSIIIRSF